ncbi:ATP-dependent DNA helicase PIF6-like [Centruroides sculpturatus]|uniref:ATP-dependent DNA helicase PIF6-like n=1 Tax=Centruroides sculpturatus TaxID=218467 RepID=UPI000C6D7C48|nr:ATP-dependent DNA helicase PIF6-like [Centruroides sculpturatus]
MSITYKVAFFPTLGGTLKQPPPRGEFWVVVRLKMTNVTNGSRVPTNEEVKQSNEDYLQSTGCPVAYIASENTPDIALPSSKDDSALGLSKYLNLSVNARIMLRVNLWVKGDLVNGSLGTIRYIIYAPNARPPALPLFILVEFDSYQGPFIYGNQFPIIPITRSSNDGSILRSRRQFSLTLAYSRTIHKSQLLTLPKIKIDIGKKETTIGLRYVAFSRVKKITDIVFLNSYRLTCRDLYCKSKAHSDRQNFMIR